MNVRNAVQNFRTKAYDTYTALFAGSLSMFFPRLAGHWHMGRTMYRTYMSGEAQGFDKGYLPRTRSAEADVRRGQPLTVARCRDQAQNNPYISGSIERMCNNVVRSGIMPEFQFREASGKLNKDGNKGWTALFKRWIRYADNTGHDSYGFLQQLGLRHMWVDGQFFIRRVYDNSIKGVVPLRLELFELDQLDTRIDGELPNGNIGRRGLELSPSGRPVAYHFLKHHPGDSVPWSATLDSIRIPAEDICHVWDRRRISQYTGISWFAAVVMEAFRMDHYRNIEHDGARAAAIFAGFLKSAMPGFTLGGNIPSGGMSAPPNPGSTGATEVPTEMKSGIIQGLPTGTEIQVLNHNKPGNNFEPFVKDSIRSQSVGTGQSFEGYSNDFSESTYASARQGSLEERLGYRAQQRFIDEKMNWKVISWFIEAAWLSGLAPVSMPDYRQYPERYTEMVGVRPPGWQWVDERSAADAANKRLENYTDCRTDQMAERGKIFSDNVEVLIDEEIELQALYKVMIETGRLREEALGESTSTAD